MVQTMTETGWLRPSLLVLAGLLGISGVGLAAAASHLGDEHLIGNAASMCLAHAPALLGIFAGYRHFRTAPVAGLLIGLGTLLFAGDLVNRHFNGQGLFPMAAPGGGIAMMAGWLCVGLGFIFRTRDA